MTTQGKWWAGAELNCRHQDFQSCALPTELPAQYRRESREPRAAKNQNGLLGGGDSLGSREGGERAVKY